MNAAVAAAVAAVAAAAATRKGSRIPLVRAIHVKVQFKVNLSCYKAAGHYRFPLAGFYYVFHDNIISYRDCFQR